MRTDEQICNILQSGFFPSFFPCFCYFCFLFFLNKFLNFFCFHKICLAVLIGLFWCGSYWAGWSNALFFTFTVMLFKNDQTSKSLPFLLLLLNYCKLHDFKIYQTNVKVKVWKGKSGRSKWANMECSRTPLKLAGNWKFVGLL